MKIKTGDTRKGLLFAAYMIVLVNLISTWLYKFDLRHWGGSPEVIEIAAGLAVGQLVLLLAVQHLTARRSGSPRQQQSSPTTACH